MSIDHMKDIFEASFDPREKLIALAIADCADKSGKCWPSYTLLMEKTGYAKATVASGLKKLKECGWCRVENHSEFGKGKKVNLYFILPKVQWLDFKRGSTKSSAVELPKVQSTKSSAVELPKVQSTKSSAVELPKVQSTPPKSSAVEHESSIEPSIKEPSIKIPADIFLFVDAFHGFLSNNGGKQEYTNKDKQSAADVVEKLVRIDRFNLENEIVPAIRWAVEDEFWCGQVRSLAALRKKSKNNGESKFNNIFNSYSSRNISRKNGKTLDEFKGMIESLNNGNNESKSIEEGNCVDSDWAIGLPLPE